MITSQSSSQSDRYRVVINSIGAATPSSAAAVAKGLGISAAEVIRCLYRAPAVLIDNVSRDIALNLHKLLEDIGYQVDIAANSVPAPVTPELFEISIYLKRADLFQSACEKLSSFIGMTTEEASKLIMTAPGTVLGSISQATVDAFIHHMNDSVEVVICPQKKGLFSIFLADCPAVVFQRLEHDLRKAGIEPLGTKGLIAADIAYDQINDLWLRHRANTHLRVVNQAFLRYDITLTRLPNSVLTDRQRQCLLENTDIPEDLIDTVIKSAPIALIESLPHASMLSLMQQFHQADLDVQADLITFQMLGLRIHSATQRTLINQVLQQFSVAPLPFSLPANLPQAFPEIQARVIQNALQQIGADVELVTL